MNLKRKWIFRKDVCKHKPKEKLVYYLFAENIVTHDLSRNERKYVKERMEVKQQKKPSKD